MIDPVLAEMLVCPDNHLPVKEADASLVATVNRAIEQGSVTNAGGEAVTETIDALLVREDGARAYIIRDDIPVMLVHEALEPQAVGLESFA